MVVQPGLHNIQYSTSNTLIILSYLSGSVLSDPLVLLQVSALERNVGETMCSLKFAERVCKVELGPAARKIQRGGGSHQCD